MNTITRGNAAEAAVLHELMVIGVHVLVPFGEGLPFDLVGVTPEGELLRLQVKSGRVRNNCVEFNACSTDHGQGRRHYRGRADLIAVHVASLGRVFIVPVEDCPSYRGYLRLVPPRNNQRRRIRLAEDYAIESWAESIGAKLAA